jgi:sulfite reductase alpha subunit-like flavoprotein
MTHRFALAAALSAALALPVQAQEDEGRSLMERGAELFLEGLAQEMAPALNDLRSMAEQFGPSMQSFFEEMGPAFAEVLSEVKDWSRYEPPEILPNGDIIIRRKADPEDEEAEEEDPPPTGPTDI